MEIDFSRILRSIRRFWWVGLVVLAVCSIAAGSLASRSGGSYTADTSLLVVVQDDLVGNAPTVIELARSNRVIAPVLKEAGVAMDTESFVSGHLRVSSISGTSLIRIEVTYADPNVAAGIANGIAMGVTTQTNDVGLGLLQRDLDNLIFERDQVAQLMITNNAQIEDIESDSAKDSSEDRAHLLQLQDQQMRLQQRLADLESKIRTAQTDIAAYSNPVIVNYEAVPPARTDGISRVLLGLAGAVAGTIIGSALMIWLELRDPNVRDEAHVRELVPAHSFMRVNKGDVAGSTSAGVGLVARRVAGLARTSESESVALVSPRPLASSATLAETLTQTVPLSELNTVVSPGILESLDGTSDISPATTALLIVEKETTRAQDLLDAVDILRDLGVTSMSAVILE